MGKMDGSLFDEVSVNRGSVVEHLFSTGKHIHPYHEQQKKLNESREFQKQLLETSITPPTRGGDCN